MAQRANTTFMNSPHYLFTSESVSEGHPDKLCDQISDAILDEILRLDPQGRVACEVSATTDFILVFGEITTSANINIEQLVRKTVQEIGYTDNDLGFDYKTCIVDIKLKAQSLDIAQGVNQALEARSKNSDGDEFEEIGAGDQGMMIGFACDETPEYMPLTIALAHKLSRSLAYARRSGQLGWLRPDGKSQVTVEYEYGLPKRVDTMIVSAQHAPEISQLDIYNAIVEAVILPNIPSQLLDNKTRIFINPTGRFVTGGPLGDAGLTGRKIIVDTYGGVARHGGGAFSGKDPTKVDRSGAYMARYIAKNVVAAGLASRFEIQVSYAIGIARPTSLAIETFGTERIPLEAIETLIHSHFDMRPAAIIDNLDLRRPLYKQVASYGHFGRNDLDLPWERIDKADILRSESRI